MSWLSSLTGQDAAKTAGNAQKSNAKISGKYASLFNGAAEDYKLLHGMFGQNQAGVNAAANSLNQDPNQRIQQFGAGATENAANNSAQIANTLRSLGFGDGAIGGAAAGQFQNAATQTNQYAQQENSPEEQMKRFLAWLQAKQGAEGQSLSALNSFGAGAMQQVPQQQGQNPLSSIAQFLPFFM